MADKKPGKKPNRKPDRKIPFIDLGDAGSRDPLGKPPGPGLPEDDRITLIGNTCLQNPGKLIGVIVENETGPHCQDPTRRQTKADRYITKLHTKFPKLTIVGKFVDAPTIGLTIIHVRYDQKRPPYQRPLRDITSLN